MAGCMMVMAGGTGGHVFPALAVAQEMQQRGWKVFWLGTHDSFESREVPKHGFAMEWINIKGMRGKGLVRKLTAPLQLSYAMLQAMNVIRRKKPDVVLGMGGFVSGPGGLMAKLMGKPLVIQEQNTVPGMTNRWLAKFANRVFEAFPGSFPAKVNATVSGNPVRNDITQLPSPADRMGQRQGVIHLLVLGGSLGAQSLNRFLPQALAQIPQELRPEIHHQAGRSKVEQTQSAYQESEVQAEVSAFIGDMAEAYSWADLVVCRSGALTVSELTATGVASLLVPFPYAVDDHQTGNARFLVDAGAAVLMQESEIDVDSLSAQLQKLLSNKDHLLQMAEAAKQQEKAGSTQIIADACEEVAA